MATVVQIQVMRGTDTHTNQARCEKMRRQLPRIKIILSAGAKNPDHRIMQSICRIGLRWQAPTRIRIDWASYLAFLEIRWAGMLLGTTLHWISMGLRCGVCLGRYAKITSPSGLDVPGYWQPVRRKVPKEHDEFFCVSAAVP